MFTSQLATPVTNGNVTTFALSQDYLENLVDTWSQETHQAGTYSAAGHVHLFELVLYAGRLDDTQKVMGLSAQRKADAQQRRFEVCNTIVSTMHQLRAGHSLGAIVGGRQ